MSKSFPSILNLGAKCSGCGACAAKCPKACIQMRADTRGFLRPTIDCEKCSSCGSCDSVCPALNVRPEDGLEFSIWAKSKNLSERLSSSSGGIFPLLARKFIADGGIVIGAAWDDDCKSVHHVLIDNINHLDDVMRSKYVQSSIGRDVYEGTRMALRANRKVLFSGTACQVAGIRAYLGKLADCDEFLSVDIICHGVPSPLLWRKWADNKELHSGLSLSAVNMRSKSTGWLSFSSTYSYSGDTESTSRFGSDTTKDDSSVFTNDWFMKAFLSNASLRESCFVSTGKRSCGSDITLGDFWGIQSAHPDVDFSGGVSAVLVNTDKGAAIVDEVKSLLEWGPSSFDKILPGNPCLAEAVLPYKKRNEFMRDLENGLSVDKMEHKYKFKSSILRRLRGKLGLIKNLFKYI